MWVCNRYQFVHLLLVDLYNIYLLKIFDDDWWWMKSGGKSWCWLAKRFLFLFLIRVDVLPHRNPWRCALRCVKLKFNPRRGSCNQGFVYCVEDWIHDSFASFFSYTFFSLFSSFCLFSFTLYIHMHTIHAHTLLLHHTPCPLKKVPGDWSQGWCDST